MPQIQVTLPAATTFYSFVSLIRGTVTSSSPTPAWPNASPYCRELTVQNDWANAAAKIAVISSAVASPTVAKGLQLQLGETLTIRSEHNDVSLVDRGVVTDTANALVDIIFEVA